MNPSSIKFFVMDADGTLTDGKIYMGEEGELFKAFHVKDGCGIKDILPEYGILPVILTARESRILQKRCKELGITRLYQNVRDKIGKMKELVQAESDRDGVVYTYKNCAYIGDDILDLQCMIPVKEAEGVVGCPADAAKEVKEIADYICRAKGGEGAVREFIEYLITTGRTEFL